MLEKKIFKEKYNTSYDQRREESFLETVSEDDRSIYTDSEILTGLSDNRGQLNKFFQTGSNKDKVYDTTKTRFTNKFKKYVDNKMAEGKEEEVFDRLWKSSMNGSFNHLKFLFERIAGKEEENINLKVEGEMTFEIDESKLIRKKKEK